MENGLAAGSGWEAAIDAPLVARLLRPAVRAGVSDPAHGAALAARLRRATPPSLADDVARRYGSAALDASRLPLVYAAPSAPAPGEAPAAPAGAPAATPADAPAVHPVARATERPARPAFPPARPLHAAPTVQRMADPAAARPVVAARQASAEARGGAAGSSSGPRAGTIPISTPPVVQPPPTRLQRQLAAERAEAGAAFSTLPLVRAAAPPARGRSAAPAGSPALSAEPGDGERANAGAGASPAGSPVVQRSAAGVVQRAADPAGPGASREDRSEGKGTAAPPAVPAPSDRRPSGQGGAADSGPPAMLPLASATAVAARASRATEPAGVVQRAADPAGSGARAGAEPREFQGGAGTAHELHGARSEQAAEAPRVVSPSADGRSPGRRGAADFAAPATLSFASVPTAVASASGAVGRDAAPTARVRAAGGPAWASASAGRSPTGRPVVAPRAGALSVQRSLLGGLAGMAVRGATRLAHAAVSAADPGAAAREGRAAATATPPPGAPPAELPTATARGAEPAGPGGAARLADEVYELLVRRLENERKQRGW